MRWTAEAAGWVHEIQENIAQDGPAPAMPVSAARAADPASGRPFRVFYGFDPERQAVLLLGGDKTGKARFYEEYVPRAESLWEQYLVELTAERSKE